MDFIETMWQLCQNHKRFDYSAHKVHIPRVPQYLPPRPNRDPTPPSLPQASVSPWNQGGGEYTLNAGKILSSLNHNNRIERWYVNHLMYLT
jgi:hypothetical protein